MLDGILQAKDREDGSIGIRCSCQAAICGSCGVRVNGQAKLACNTKLEDAAGARGRRRDRRRADGQHAGAQGPDREHGRGPLEEGPAGRAVAAAGGRPARARVRRAAGVDDRRHAVDGVHPLRRLRLGLPVARGGPAVHRPAALAKAYRFVGDPRDGQTEERLRDLAEDPHGIYDCTHCFSCIEVCPKGVAPMDQIMRLRGARPTTTASTTRTTAPPRAGVHEDHPQEGHARRAQAAPGQLRAVPPAGRDRAAAGAAHRPARLRARQDHAEDGALPREAAGRRERAAHLRARRGAPRRS